MGVVISQCQDIINIDENEVIDNQQEIKNLTAFKQRPKIFQTIMKSPIQQTIQIFIHNLIGKSIAYQVKLSDTVLKLKSQIQQKEGIPPQQLRLVYAGKQLDDKHDLSSYKIKNHSFLNVLLRLRAGGPQILFNSLQKKITKQFKPKGQKSSKSLNYSKVVPGLNLQARCKNINCQAFNKRVWIQKGYGYFNIGKQMFICKCPSCDEETEQATNIGYYQTFIKIQGKKTEDTQIVRWQETVTQHSFTTFLNNDEDLRYWNFLEITTKKIEQQNKQ